MVRLFLITILFTQYTYSQNLLRNSSFENFIGCQALNDEFSCEDWYSVNGSVDYYNLTCKDNYLPDSRWVLPNPNFGKAFIGLRIIDIQGNLEHAQGELLKPLLPDHYYKLELYIRNPSKIFLLTSANLEGYFTSERIVWGNDPYYNLKQLKSNIPVKYKKFYSYNYINAIYPYEFKAQVHFKEFDLSEDEKWLKISNLFKAKGGEKYLTLGLFSISNEELKKQILEQIRHSKYDNNQLPYIVDNLLLKNVDVDQWANETYLFIDDVSVTPVDENGNEIILYPELLQPDSIQEKPINIDSIEIGQPVTLKNIYFEFDKSELLPESYPELNKLVTAMQKTETMEVEISGHTDNTGTEEYNKELSESRAKSVVDYLTGQGISPERLQYKGHGRSKPIADNTTEEGRAKNRRVEFTIIKK